MHAFFLTFFLCMHFLSINHFHNFNCLRLSFILRFPTWHLVNTEFRITINCIHLDSLLTHYALNKHRDGRIPQLWPMNASRLQLSEQEVKHQAAGTTNNNTLLAVKRNVRFNFHLVSRMGKEATRTLYTLARTSSNVSCCYWVSLLGIKRFGCFTGACFLSRCLLSFENRLLNTSVQQFTTLQCLQMNPGAVKWSG